MTALGVRRGAPARGVAILRGAMLALVVAAAEFGIAIAAASSPAHAAIAAMAAVIVVVGCFLWPVPVMVLAFPATFFAWRVGPGWADMSLTDAVAFAALFAALPYVPWRSRKLQRALLAIAAYCAVASVSVAANFNKGSVIGVLHRFEFVAGALCIGAALANLGRVRTALRALVLCGVAISIAAIVDTIGRNFQPAYPFGLQKNGYATLACSAFLVILFAGRRLEWPRGAAGAAGVLLLGGVAASQSRGVALALAAVLAIYALRAAWRGGAGSRRLAKVAPLVFLAALSLVAIAAVTFQQRDAKLTPDEAKFGSVETRITTYDIAWRSAIKPHPVLGAGPGWFERPGSPGGAPHDIVIGELSEVGALGLAALLWFLWRVLRTTNQVDTDIRRVAGYALLARVLASTVDIFWVAGPTTLPFLLVGLAVGEEPVPVPEPTPVRSLVA